jgi:polyhydroxyalkanoate synthesis regulator phasin
MGNLRNRLLQLLQDPRVAKLLADPRAQKALMQGLRFRGRVQEQIDQRLERMARRLNLATAREVRELKRTIRRLEEQLRDRPSSN